MFSSTFVLRYLFQQLNQKGAEGFLVRFLLLKDDGIYLSKEWYECQRGSLFAFQWWGCFLLSHFLFATFFSS